jgi:hypothetical protein
MRVLARPRRLNLVAACTGILAIAVWWPVLHQFESWVHSHDVHKLRSNLLGYMTQGSNPVTLDEYFGRYRHLDAAAEQGSKRRVLLAVLVTKAGAAKLTLCCQLLATACSQLLPQPADCCDFLAALTTTNSGLCP